MGIYASITYSEGRSCDAKRLDNEKDNFAYGSTDIFTGKDIGDCDDFEIETGSWVNIEVRHSLSDGWLGEWMKIELDESTLMKCPIDQWLDNSQTMTLNCS